METSILAKLQSYYSMIKFFSNTRKTVISEMRDKIPEITVVSGIPFHSIPETTQKLDHRVLRMRGTD
jgi:hypothetical protein